MIRMFAWVSVIFGLVTSAAAATVPTATLTVVPDTILPGLPTAFVVSILNPNLNAAATVINGLQLSVTGPTGAFVATGLGGRQTVDFVTDLASRCGGIPCVEVPPNGQSQIYVPPGPNLAENEFFADRRLSQPGQYDFVLSFNVAVAGATPVRIQTNAARLTVSQPTGSDLLVWHRMLQLSGGSGWNLVDWAARGSGLAAEIRSLYPASGYAAWVGAMGYVSNTSSALSQIDAALARAPAASVRDDLLLTKGSFAAEASANALRVDRDEDSALTLADTARAAFTTLSNLALSLAYRKRAADALTHLYTRRTADDELRRLALLDPPAPLQVTPRVECVSRGTGQSFSARFGYSNPNSGIKVVELGSANQLTPAPRDVTQPRVFRPGSHSNVFNASSPGGELKWHLDGNVATATADFPTQCSP